MCPSISNNFLKMLNHFLQIIRLWHQNAVNSPSKNVLFKFYKVSFLWGKNGIEVPFSFIITGANILNFICLIWEISFCLQ